MLKRPVTLFGTPFVQQSNHGTSLYINSLNFSLDMQSSVHFCFTFVSLSSFFPRATGLEVATSKVAQNQYIHNDKEK